MATTLFANSARPSLDSPVISRIRSIDMARGAVMVLMALDHTRWFFTNISGYQPETLERTTLVLFLTRWVTHFCAPGFFLLAGFGIFLYGSKVERKIDLVRYLLTRGALLIALELTIVGFSWVFTPGYSFAGVIWSLGWCFLLMSALTLLPARLLLATSALFLVSHNFLLGHVRIEGAWETLAWRFFYMPGSAAIPGITDSYYFLFPILPWLAIMVLGYALGGLFQRPLQERQRRFAQLGIGFIVAFVALRLTNLYGEPATLWISGATSGDFAIQDSFAKTVVSFLDTEKYPPSLQYALMTLGPIFLWLGMTRVDGASSRQNSLHRALILFGRVPLFYYILHLYLIHLMALGLSSAFGQPTAWIAFGADPDLSREPGFGFDIWVVHVMWMTAVAILYFACRWYAAFKRTHDYAWLKYL